LATTRGRSGERQLDSRAFWKTCGEGVLALARAIGKILCNFRTGNPYTLLEVLTVVGQWNLVFSE
jgi:hypothetical protein